MGHFGLSAYRILMFFLFLSIYFDVENPKMKIILWRNDHSITIDFYLSIFYWNTAVSLCTFSTQTHIVDMNLSFVDAVPLWRFFFFLKLCHIGSQ